MRKPAKILIVEDSPTQLEQLKYILEQSNYQVITAFNASEALKLLDSQNELPDLIITDVVMPEVNGYELTKSIKSNFRLKEIKVILLTSLSDPANILKGIECGANNFITKPYEPQFLLDRVHSILVNGSHIENQDNTGLINYHYKGENYRLSSSSNQILDFLISSYETAIDKNTGLLNAKDELLFLNTNLEERVEERTAELNELIAHHQKTEIILKRTMEALTNSNRELEQFAYIASHDLQEPLRMVSSFVQLLAIRYKDKLDTNANEFIGFAVDGATRMQSMIQDLLQFSRIGTKGDIFKKVDSKVVLDKAINNLHVKIEETGTTISFDEMPVIIGDESQLIRLFQNLIDNAIKFCRNKKPVIFISSKLQDDEWIFSVQDNGIGIDPQFQERVFRIFQRLNSREEFVGTGIGLAICKRIVERHNGKIWFESKPGEGTTIYFTIYDKGEN